MIHKDYAIFCPSQNRKRAIRGIGDTKFGHSIGFELDIADYDHLVASRRASNPGARSNHGGTANATLAAVIPHRPPSLRLLSSQTTPLTLPSFFPRYAKAIADLLASKRSELKRRRNWIIDVRRNNGGNDSTDASLLPWIASGERVNMGGEWLSTPASIANQENICALYVPDDASCPISMARTVTRLPRLQVGLGGIQPDIYLPPPKDEAGREDEIVRVRRWLEGGTLRPDSA